MCLCPLILKCEARYLGNLFVFPFCQFKTHCSHSLLLAQTHYTVPDPETDLESLNATIECEQPQPDLYKYALVMWPQQIYTTRL